MSFLFYCFLYIWIFFYIYIAIAWCSRHSHSSATGLNDTSLAIPAATSSERRAGSNENKTKGSSHHTLSSAKEQTILDDTSLGATSSALVPKGNNVKIIITINPEQQAMITINPEQQTVITINPEQQTGTVITINKHEVNAQTGSLGQQETSNATKCLSRYHPHNLELNNSTRSSYKCSGCKDFGFGERYECKRCHYFLHPDCMYYKETATHRFLEGSIFKFYQKPSSDNNRYCDACGMDILGFYYHCKKTNKDLHPCCLNLQETVVIGDKNFQLCQELPSKCWCCNSKKNKERDKGWCYSLKSQDWHFHVYCMKNQLRTCLDGGGNSAMVVMKHRKALKALKWVGTFLNVMYSVLTGNPVSLSMAVVQLLQP